MGLSRELLSKKNAARFSSSQKRSSCDVNPATVSYGSGPSAHAIYSNNIHKLYGQTMKMLYILSPHSLSISAWMCKWPTCFFTLPCPSASRQSELVSSGPLQVSRHSRSLVTQPEEFKEIYTRCLSCGTNRPRIIC